MGKVFGIKSVKYSCGCVPNVKSVCSNGKRLKRNYANINDSQDPLRISSIVVRKEDADEAQNGRGK